MSQHVKYVTKFFELKDTKYYHAGQIKFGTLQEYSKLENDYLAARVDRTEGKEEIDRTFHMPHPKDVTIGNLLRIKGENIFNINVQTFQSRVLNEWVFCSSCGAYDPATHRNICDGNAEYAGSIKLLGYAVFDVDKLTDAIAKISVSHPNFKAKLGEQIVSHGNVNYEKHSIYKEDSHLGTHYSENSEELDVDGYLRLIFSKPAHFRSENEYRIALRLHAPRTAPGNASPVILKSTAIRRSIVDIWPSG